MGEEVFPGGGATPRTLHEQLAAFPKALSSAM